MGIPGPTRIGSVQGCLGCAVERLSSALEISGELARGVPRIVYSWQVNYCQIGVCGG